MPSLTIHTATYNRAYILPKAYESLKKQTCKEFEWIITDDGSTDNTEELVSNWLKQDNGFKIIYNKLNHVGIPRALNSGVNLSNTEWFMMLDSDDYIKPETVDRVLSWLDEIKYDESFAGVGFAKCFPNGDFVKPQVPIIDPEIGYIDATHIERKKYNLNMDLCEVHRVSLFKQYPFQYWETEKFAPEQLNYYEIAMQGYKLRWRMDKLYICEYLPTGMTRDDKLVKRNPMGFAMMYNQNILLSETIKEKVVNVLRMSALALYSHNPQYIWKCNSVPLAIITLPVGFVLFLRRKRQYRLLED